MNSFMNVMAFKIMMFLCIISLFSIILNLIRLFISKKEASR